MKYISLFSRILVGTLFIFSGFVKFNDPVGFSIKMEEYFEVFSEDLATKQDSLYIRISDTKGNSISKTLPTYSKQNSHSYQIAQQSEFYELNANLDSIYLTSVSVKFGEETAYEEAFFHETGKTYEDKLNLTWNLGKQNSEVIHTDILPFENFSKTEIIDIKAYLKESSFLSDFFTAIIPYALWIGMFICIFELVLGFTLLIGWKPVATTWLMLLMIAFFTFLTGYSAVYNKVTDCGCFGDAIKLTPWESFYKDIVLSVLILILFIRRKKLKAVFSIPFAVKSVVFVSLLSIAYSLYALIYLPPINFLNFKNGNDLLVQMAIPKGMPAQDIKEFKYFYKSKKDGIEKEFTIDNAPVGSNDWEFVRRDEVLIQKAYKPKLDNFNNIIHPEKGDISKEILSTKGYHLMIVSSDFADANEKGLEKVYTLEKEWTEKTGLPVWILNGSTPNIKEKFAPNFQNPVLTADKTFIKSIIRSNPGIILMNGTKVVKNYPHRRIPSFKRLSKKLK